MAFFINKIWWTRSSLDAKENGITEGCEELHKTGACLKYTTWIIHSMTGSAVRRVVSSGCHYGYIGIIEGISKGIFFGLGLALYVPVTVTSGSCINMDMDYPNICRDLWDWDVLITDQSYFRFNKIISFAGANLFGICAGGLIGGTIGTIYGIYLGIFNHPKNT